MELNITLPGWKLAHLPRREEGGYDGILHYPWQSSRSLVTGYLFTRNAVGGIIAAAFMPNLPYTFRVQLLR